MASKEEIRGLLDALTKGTGSEERKRANGEQMKEIFRIFEDQYLFAPGDLIQWKPGLRIANHPQYGEPAIVVEMLDGSAPQDRESGSLYYLNRLDIGCLALLDDGSYGLFAYDSRYMMPYHGRK